MDLNVNQIKLLQSVRRFALLKCKCCHGIQRVEVIDTDTDGRAYVLPVDPDGNPLAGTLMQYPMARELVTE